MLDAELSRRLFAELRRRGLDVYPEQPIAAFRAEVARMGLPALARRDLTVGDVRAWLEEHEGEPLPPSPECPDCSHPLRVHRAGVGRLACGCAREHGGDR